MTTPATLTVEGAAGINAFIQELEIRAIHGKVPGEENIALGLLAQKHAGPEFNPASIRSFAQMNGETSAVTVASADGDDKFDKLAALMMGDTKDPGDQAASGQVPKPPPIAVLPGYTNKDVQDNYSTLMDASSMCQLYANLMQVQQKPDGFNITSDAAEAYNFQAKMAFDAMMGPLAGFYIFGMGSKQTYNDTIPKDQVHANLLGKVFNGFGFDKATTDALDVQLTNFVAGLGKIAPGNANSYDFMLRLNLVPRKNVTGDETDPIYVYQPSTFLIYMTVDGESFRASTGKHSHEDRVNFKFSLTVTKCELNTRKFEQNREKFDQMFQLVTNSNLRAYSDLLNKQIKSDEPNPGGDKK